MKEIAWVRELLYEVENKLFIPKRFRKEPFTDEKRLTYVEYLETELERMKKKEELRK